MKKILLLLLCFGMLLLFTGCYFTPQGEYKISNLIELRIQPYQRVSFKMSTPSGILGKTDTKNGNPVLHGTVYEANFTIRGEIGELSLVAGLADSNSVANELWTYYRKSDKPSLMAWLNHIPLYYGSYEKHEEETFILCWFSKKWFFRVEGPDEKSVRDFYAKLESFIQKDEILNGSIRDI